MQLALPGVVYLYNGEELGLANVDLRDHARTDPHWRQPDGAVRGRDGVRVPIPWEGSEPPFAFSATSDTWLPMPAEWSELTVVAQLEDPDSTLSLYRRAIELRRQHSAFTGNELAWYGAPTGCFAFRRDPGDLVCTLNTGAAPVDLPPSQLLLSSMALVDGKLPPNAAVWLV